MFKSALTLSLLAALTTSMAAQTDLHRVELERRAKMRRSAPTPLATTTPQMAVAEREYNNSSAWAQTLTPGVDIDGSLDSTTDRDVYRLDLASDSVVTVLVSPGSGTPVGDPDLAITDPLGQWIEYSIDQSSTNPYPGLSFFQPAGTVYLHVIYQQGATGTYRLSVATTPTPIPAVVPATTIAGTMSSTAAGPTWRLTLTAESRIQMTGTAGGQVMYADLRLADGHYIALSLTSRSDPTVGFDVVMAPGDYLLFFGTSAVGPIPFTFRVDVTQTAMKVLPCPGSATGDLVTDRTHELFRFTLATQSRVQLDLGSNGLTFAAIELRDAVFTTAMFASGLVPTGPLIDTVLPAGTYYAHVSTLFDFGGFTINAQCTPVANLPRLEFGRTDVNVPIRQQPAYDLSLATPNPLEVAITPISGTWYAPTVAVLDRAGIVRASQVHYLFQTGDYASQQLPAGDYIVLVGENSGWGPLFGVDARPPLSFIDRVNNRQLLSLGKTGDVVFAFAAAQALSSPLALPAPLQGNLLIDLSAYVPLGSLSLPIAGQINWPYDFTGFDVVAQSLTLDSNLQQGSASDLVR